MCVCWVLWLLKEREETTKSELFILAIVAVTQQYMMEKDVEAAK